MRLATLCVVAYFCGLGVRGTHLRWQAGTATHGSDESASAGAYPRVASTRPAIRETSLRPLQLYTDVYKRLQATYVDPLPSDTELALGSVRAMVDALGDPNSRLLTARETEGYEAARRGEFSGLGAVLTIRRVSGGALELGGEEGDLPQASAGGVRTITVVSVLPGSPAQDAGLQPGDRITEIDGRWIAPAHFSYRELTQITDPVGPQDGSPPGGEAEPMPPASPAERDRQKRELDDLRGRLKSAAELNLVLRTLVGDGKGEHELTIARGAERPRKLHVAFRQHTVAPVVGSRAGSDVGVLRVQVIGPSTVEAAAGLLAGFTAAGLKHLVVDLRDCPGGDLDAAASLAGKLAGRGAFATLRRRDAAGKAVDQPILAGTGTDAPPFRSVAVVINKGTAGAAELLAAYVRDQLGALVYGTPSFGDGSHQKLLKLEDGSAVLLTPARMLTGRLAAYDGRGLPVDRLTPGDALEAAAAALQATGKGG